MPHNNTLNFTFTFVMNLRQELPVKVGDLNLPVSNDLIDREVVFRRFNPTSVESMGGQYAKRLLAVAGSLGMVRDTTRIMVQKTPIVAGTFPDIPQWHLDCIPGLPARLAQTIRDKIDGLICVILDTETHPNDRGTLFLEGDLHLDMNEEADSDYVPGSHLSLDSGRINWIHPQVEKQLGKNLNASHLIPNTIYRYSSDQFHKAPVMVGNSGKRLVIRLNTPPDNFLGEVPVNNQIITPEPSYVFRVNEGHMEWTRENHM